MLVLVLVGNGNAGVVADGLLRCSTARGQQSKVKAGLLSERGETAAAAAAVEGA